jgi:hypothetical protein
MQSDLSLLKSLQTCRNLLEQGYEDKVRRILAKANVEIVSSLGDEEAAGRELGALADTTKVRVDKAIVALATKPEEKPASSTDDEPEAKKRREDMDEDEGKEFDLWIEEIKKKR